MARNKWDGFVSVVSVVSVEVSRPRGFRVWVGVQLVIVVVSSLSLFPRSLIKLTNGETVVLCGKLVFGNGHRTGSICVSTANPGLRRGADLPEHLSIDRQELLHGIFAATLLQVVQIFLADPLLGPS